MTARLAIIFTLLLCRTLSADAPDQVKIDFIVRVPASTTGSVYIAGGTESLGLWKPDHFALKRSDDGTHRASVALKKGQRVEFKLTRGSWDIVEKGAKGEEIANRLLVADEVKTVEIDVASWSSPTRNAPRKSTATGDIRLHENFHSKLLDNARRIWVWLPPSYGKDSEARYPVLYMHDGQNVFDESTSFAGEWRADETAAKLIESKRIVPIIMVAIENNAQRMDEYTHTRRGDRYARFLLDELKPFVDRTYRTRSGREHTAVAGSSLGGLISLHIVSKHPDRVGMAGVISPALWWDERRLLDDVAKDTAWTRHARIWLDVGTKEGTDAERYLSHTRELANVLRTAGLQESQDFAYREVQDAPHNEAAWAARFDQVLEFFFRHR